MIYLKVVAIIACVVVLGFSVYLGCSNLITTEKDLWFGLPFLKRHKKPKRTEALEKCKEQDSKAAEPNEGD